MLHGEHGPPAHVTDVDNEQRCVVAVDDAARQGLGVGVVVDVMHPGQPRHAAEDAVVGASQSVHDLDQAERDRQPDAKRTPNRTVPRAAVMASTSSVVRNRASRTTSFHETSMAAA